MHFSFTGKRVSIKFRHSFGFYTYRNEKANMPFSKKCFYLSDLSGFVYILKSYAQVKEHTAIHF